jgi:hypothetical protein
METYKSLDHFNMLEQTECNKKAYYFTKNNISTKKEIFSYARRTIVKVSVGSGWNIEKYEIENDERLRNESKTQFP